MYKRLLAIIGMSTLSFLSEASTVTLAPQAAGSYQNGNGENSQRVPVYARASEESGGPDGWRGPSAFIPAARILLP